MKTAMLGNELSRFPIPFTKFLFSPLGCKGPLYNSTIISGHGDITDIGSSKDVLSIEFRFQDCPETVSFVELIT